MVGRQGDVAAKPGNIQIHVLRRIDPNQSRTRPLPPDLIQHLHRLVRIGEIDEADLRIGHPDQPLRFAHVRIMAQRRMHHQRPAIGHDGLQHASPRFVRENKNGR